MISYIDYDENDYTDDDFYYESKKDKIKKNKENLRTFNWNIVIKNVTQ